MVNDEYSADQISVTSLIPTDAVTDPYADPDDDNEDDLSSGDDEYVQSVMKSKFDLWGSNTDQSTALLNCLYFHSWDKYLTLELRKKKIAQCHLAL